MRSRIALLVKNVLSKILGEAYEDERPAFKALSPGRGLSPVEPNQAQFEKGSTMSFVQIASRRFGIAGELLVFFWSNKRWWMVPIVVALLVLGALIILAQSSAIAPFIYTVF